MTKPSPGQRPGGSVSIVASALKGRAQSVGRLVRPFRPEWGFGVGFPSVLPWAGFGEGRWPADTDHTPRGDGSWEAACSFLNCSRAMNRGEIHHGDTEAQRYKRSVLFLRASVPLWCKPGSWEGSVGAGTEAEGTTVVAPQFTPHLVQEFAAAWLLLLLHDHGAGGVTGCERGGIRCGCRGSLR